MRTVVIVVNYGLYSSVFTMVNSFCLLSVLRYHMSLFTNSNTHAPHTVNTHSMLLLITTHNSISIV